MIAPPKTRKRLFWLGLSVPMAALVAMTWLVHQAGGQFNSSFNWVMQTYKVLDLFEQSQAHIVEAEAGQRGYLLTGREEYLEPYRAAMQSIHDDLAALKTFTRTDPAQLANVTALEKLVASELEFDPATAFAAGRPPTNASIFTLTASGKRKLDDMRKVVFQAREEQQHALSEHQRAAEADVIASQIMSLVLIVSVAVALAFVVMILLRLDKLQQFVTVCAWTGQVKYQGQWLRLDEYLKRHFGLSVSHSLSEEAAEKMKHEIETLSRDSGLPPPAG
jgi:CHASE3 domain sensor protein